MANSQSLTPPRAVILAGGLGTRLRSVVSDSPKSLASVRGRDFITFLLDMLVRQGITSTVLCTGYLGEMVSERLGTHWGPMSLHYSQEQQPLGTAGAIRLAFDHFGDSTPWLVLNGDSYLDLELDALATCHRQSGLDVTLSSVWVQDRSRFGGLEIAPPSPTGSRVTAFHEKSPNAGPGWINAGIYWLEPRFLASLPAVVPASLEREVFPLWLDRGINAHCSHGRFLDIGTPETYEDAQRFFSFLTP